MTPAKILRSACACEKCRFFNAARARSYTSVAKRRLRDAWQRRYEPGAGAEVAKELRRLRWWQSHGWYVPASLATTEEPPKIRPHRLSHAPRRHGCNWFVLRGANEAACDATGNIWVFRLRRDAEFHLQQYTPEHWIRIAFDDAGRVVLPEIEL